MKHYATSRKIAGSIPDVIGYFSIDIILPAALWTWGPAHKADNLTSICELSV
jgi:hypothetical protein